MPKAGFTKDSEPASSQEWWRCSWWLFLLAAPVVCVAAYYAPLLASLGWYATHGMSINYRGLRVRVPIGWTAVRTAEEDDFVENPQGVTIERQPRSLGVKAKGVEMMYFNLLLPEPGTTPSHQAAEWQRFFRQAHPVSGFDLAIPADLPSGMECVQATPHNRPSDAAVACVSPEKGWLAQFAGSQAYVPTFLEVSAQVEVKTHR